MWFNCNTDWKNSPIRYEIHPKITESADFAYCNQEKAYISAVGKTIIIPLEQQKENPEIRPPGFSIPNGGWEGLTLTG